MFLPQAMGSSASTTTSPLAAAAADAAAAGKDAGSLPDAVVDALERYGQHAKAAYVLFGKFQDRQGQGQAANIDEEEFRGAAPADCKRLANVFGYVGAKNVFAHPVKVDDGLLGPAGLPQPSFLGYICEGKDVATENGKLPELVIAFRGTSVTPDWVNNLLGGVAAKDVYETGCVHQGFHNLLYVAPDPADKTPIEVIEAAMEKYRASHSQYPPRVITTGHSLGGALATIAAAHIAIKYGEKYQAVHTDYTQRPLQTYTFAAPRVGDAELCSYFHDKLGYSAVQVKNLQDPVPMFAPGECGAAFTKLGQLIAAYLPKPFAAGGGDGSGLAPAAAGDAAAAASTAWSGSSHKLLRYQEVAVESEGYETFEDYIIDLEQQSQAAADGMLAPTAAMSLREKLRYARELRKTFKTKWADNPAPPVGVFDSKEGGDWGGPMHSLELYLKHIKHLKTH
ncbi:hypothetical protein OEZ86_008579 [Tetradesmus obliquus]|nr:hypothetical protein OEZ86_008579 [Tetradesmus obliquus]